MVMMKFKVTHIDNNNVALTDFNNELLPKTLTNWYGYCVVFEKYHNTNMILDYENKTIILNVSDDVIRNKFIVGESVWLYDIDKNIKKKLYLYKRKTYFMHNSFYMERTNIYGEKKLQ